VAILVLDPGDPDVLKVADAIGFPFRVTVGVRDLAGGTAELVRRDTGERQALPVDIVAARVLDLIRPIPD
jgi:prolyl-tRNA synthetase